MGTWNTKINGNDTFQDIYQNFFDLYNQGQNPAHISKQIQDHYAESFNDYDSKNNSLFALALAQWETKSLDQNVYRQVKEIIETDNDLEVWKSLGADSKKTFQIIESYLNGEYKDTSSGINWAGGGGSVFYFYTKGKFVTAHWVDSQTLEIRHDKTIEFAKKNESFYFYGDQGIIKYIAE